MSIISETLNLVVYILRFMLSVRNLRHKSLLTTEQKPFTQMIFYISNTIKRSLTFLPLLSLIRITDILNTSSICYKNGFYRLADLNILALDKR